MENGTRWKTAVTSRVIGLVHGCGKRADTSLTCVVIKVDPSSHGVDHRLRLLKDLLLHEGAVVPCGGTKRNQALSLKTMTINVYRKKHSDTLFCVRPHKGSGKGIVGP